MIDQISYDRRSRVTWASSIPIRKPVWVWSDEGYGRLAAGTLAIIGGREGTGKTLFGAQLSALLTRGELPGSYMGQPTRVFYVAVEDSWSHTLVPRLIAVGADLDRIARFDVFTSTMQQIMLSLPTDLGLLEQSVKEHDARMIVIDPLMSVIGGHINTHNEREVRQALDPLAQLAERTGTVIVGIAHFNKGRGTDASSLITGSGAFKNVPRSVFAFARDDSVGQGTRVMTQVKNSLGRDDLPSRAYKIESVTFQSSQGEIVTGCLVSLGVSARSVADILQERHGDPTVTEGLDAKSFIRRYLAQAGGEAVASEVISAGEEEGFKSQTLKNARRRVADFRRRGNQPDQETYWRLHRHLMDQAMRNAMGSGTTADTSGTALTQSVCEVPDSAPENQSHPSKSGSPASPAPAECREEGRFDD